LAYFTDPMGDEFKKAIEEALKELEEGKPKKKQPVKGNRAKNRQKKKPANRLSRATRKALK
jgi:hypothetical protein